MQEFFTLVYKNPHAALSEGTKLLLTSDDPRSVLQALSEAIRRILPDVSKEEAASLKAQLKKYKTAMAEFEEEGPSAFETWADGAR